MRVFDDIIEACQDGKYHDIEEIQSRVAGNLNENQLEATLGALDRAGFIKRQRRTWSTRTRQVKLTPEMLNFLKRIKELENDETPEAPIE